MAQQQISPVERAKNFQAMTRRFKQTLATKTGAESTMVTFDIPKVRLLAGLELRVEATLNAKHSSATSYTAHEDSPWKFVKRVEVSLNNGFSPFSISGQGLYLYNATMKQKAIYDSATSGRGNVVQGLTASSSGTDNTVRICGKLPVSLNERDAIGYILAQNDETLVQVNVTLGTTADLAPASSGYTFATSNIKVSLVQDSFSVPAMPQAFPDLSVLKLVNERTFDVIQGENTLYLPVGQIYRKLGFILYNGTPARVADSGITSNVELILQQSDIIYRLNPLDLASQNAFEFGSALPDGHYMIDMSNNGIPNYGGSRDLIDTESVTEFWLKFTSAAAGTVKVVYETLSKLK